MPSPKYNDKDKSLVIRTRELFKADPRSMRDISIECGLGFSWLQTFSAGKIKNPSVNRVQYLYEFLTQSKLQLK